MAFLEGKYIIKSMVAQKAPPTLHFSYISPLKESHIFGKCFYDKKIVFANSGNPKCSKINLQIDFGHIFYNKPHQKITSDSLVPSELSENLKIGLKSTRKFSWVGGRGEAY